MAKVRRSLVRQRVRGYCEYCQLAQVYSVLPHQIDHVRATKHRGPNTMENTCFACALCNAAKGPNVAGYDVESDGLVPLLNPRVDTWDEHFRWQGEILVGQTAVGRATIEVLGVNDPDCGEQRQELIEAGLFPPPVTEPEPLPRARMDAAGARRLGRIRGRRPAPVRAQQQRHAVRAAAERPGREVSLDGALPACSTKAGRRRPSAPNHAQRAGAWSVTLSCR